MNLREKILYFFRGEGASWSQFGEDARIRCYFRDKGWQEGKRRMSIEKGIYVDVGCHHPIVLSNTLWFYRQGWTGINIDPMPGVKRLFDRFRPKDINLELAISTSTGELTFYAAEGRASVYNTANSDVARKLVADGTVKNMVEVKVQCATLANVLERHLPKDREISFLSVDAEGHDFQVLQSNNWEKFRPEILLVEAHGDSLRELIDCDVAHYMKSKGYRISSWMPPTVIFQRC
jgi:FkbM family methyltransferase